MELCGWSIILMKKAKSSQAISIPPKENYHRRGAEGAERSFSYLAGRGRQIERLLPFSTRPLLIATAIIEGDLNPEGTEFLIQSLSPDWTRTEIPLRDLRGSAVNLIMK